MGRQNGNSSQTMTPPPAIRTQATHSEQAVPAFRWASVVLLGAMALVPLVLSLNMSRLAYDDAYITYRYAQNILAGKGFVYNLSERVLGTTTPLYTLLLAGLGLLYADLPRLSRLAGAIAWSGTVLLSYLSGRRMGTWLTGLTAAGLLALSPLVLASVGMETPLYLFLFSGAVYCYLRRHLEATSVFLALLLLTRGDGILLAAVLGLHYLWQERRIPWRPLILYIVITAPWFLYSTLTFGSPFPNSLTAKMGQATKPGLDDVGGRPGSFLFGFSSIGRSWMADSVFYVLFIPLSLFSLWPRQRFDSHRLILLGWAILYILGYTILGVISFTWYYAPLAVPLALLAGLGATDLYQWLERQPWVIRPSRRSFIPTLALGLVLGPLALGHNSSLSRELSAKAPKLASYRQVGEWLREHTPSHGSVATIEIGIIGYYAERKIIDTMGLVTPGMTAHLQSWLQTLQYAVSRYQPDYAVTLPHTAWDGMVTADWFTAQYQPCHQINDVTIYCRRDDAPAYTSFRDVSLQMGEQIEITGLELEAPRVRPGETLNVVIHWQTNALLDKNHIVLLALLDEATNQVWAKAHGHPMHDGAPTSLWLVGEDIADEHHLAVPPDAPFGRYQMWVGIGSEKEMVPVTTIKIAPPEPLTCPAEMEPFAATFGEAVTLVGFNLNGKSQPGATLALDLCWQAGASSPTDYTVFVHLLNEENHLVAQVDGQPLDGRYPLSIWEPGELVPDKHLLQLPTNLPPGIYHLQIGFYNWMTEVRLPAFSPQGVHQPNDSLALTTIEIVSQQ